MRKKTDLWMIWIIVGLALVCGLGIWLRPDAARDARQGTQTVVQSSNAGETPTETLDTAFSCIPLDHGYQTGVVTAIIDGDTIYVQMDGKEFSVRYIGIDAPELDEHEPLAEESRDWNASLVDGKTVTLVRDVSETDVYGRLLRYVLVGDVFVNAELVAEGLVAVKAYPPDLSCHDTLLAARK